MRKLLLLFFVLSLTAGCKKRLPDKKDYLVWWNNTQTPNSDELRFHENLVCEVQYNKTTKKYAVDFRGTFSESEFVLNTMNYREYYFEFTMINYSFDLGHTITNLMVDPNIDLYFTYTFYTDQNPTRLVTWFNGKPEKLEIKDFDINNRKFKGKMTGALGGPDGTINMDDVIFNFNSFEYSEVE